MNQAKLLTLAAKIAGMHQAAKHGTALADEALASQEVELLELYGLLFPAELPEPEPEPGDPPSIDPPTFPSEAEYGCPPSLDLVDWIFAEIKGAGCPPGVCSVDPKAVGDGPATFSGFQLTRETKTNDRGLLSPVGHNAEGIVFRNGRVLGAKKWGANGHVRGAVFDRLSFIGTEVEHDLYVKLNGGGSGLVCTRLFSRNTASQCLQVAKREWEVDDFGPGGPIVVQDWLAINHGGGERESQAFKVFSAQAGTSGDDSKWVQLPHDVALRRLWLDDSMRATCMGVAFVGDARSFVIDGVHAVGGELLQHAIDVFPGEGPAYLGGLDLWYASAEGGRGVQIADLDRPVMIPPGRGNLRIIGPSGETLSHVRDGYSQHWTPEIAAEVKP